MPLDATRQVHVNQWLRGANFRRRIAPSAALLAVLLLAQPLQAQQKPGAPEADPLMRARVLYNQGDFSGAIALAIKARVRQGNADSAELVLARAYLERFRRAADRADLVAARESLKQVRSDRLAARDRTDLLVGLGEALFLEGSFGPAAELFEDALAASDPPPPAQVPAAANAKPAATMSSSSAALSGAARERVLDWWAAALDREAQVRLPIDRDELYARIRSTAQRELARSPGSAVAAYWLPAANRALGDLERAWDTAISGWVRAILSGEAGAGLRTDLDRLVLQAIIPERVRLQAEGDLDRERLAADMRAAWEAVKKDWGRS